MSGVCLDVDALKAIVLDEMPEGRLSESIQHLNTCVKCRLRLEEVAGTSALSDDLTALSEPADVGQSLEKAIDQLEKSRTQHLVSRTHFDLSSIVTPCDDEDLVGLFGPYQVIEVAGRGGMGLVLKAIDPKLDRVVAIKLMSTNTSPELRDRFLREARSAAAVVHENVVTIHAADELDETPYIVMQYVDGPTLEDVINDYGPLPAPQIVDIANQVATGLAAAHRRGLVHRDIKPANILIDSETGQALLSDFGLVKNNEEGGSELTRTGMLVGTPKYMSPEQATERTTDARSDLFSLGGVLYAMCTGKAPFGGDSTLEILQQVRDHSPQPIHDLNRTIPNDLISVIGRLQQKSPEDRFQSANELLVAMSTSSMDEPDAEKPPQQKKMSAPLVLLLGCLVVAALLFALRDPVNGSGQPFSLKSNGQSYATLAEAIEAATDEDTLSITGSGPYETEPIVLSGKSLTIESENATQIVAGDYSGPMLTVESSCVLEGLTLSDPRPGRLGDVLRGEVAVDWEQDSTIRIDGEGKLRISYCELRSGTDRIAFSHHGKEMTIDNSVLHCATGGSVSWRSRDKSALSITNTEIHSTIGVWADETDSELRLERVTWLGDRHAANSQFLRIREADEPDADRLQVDLRQCLIVGDVLLHFRSRIPRAGRDAVSKSIRLTESENVYAVRTYLQSGRRKEPSLFGWRDFLGSTDTTSVAAKIQVGDDMKVDPNAIEWSDSEQVAGFGAPATIGPAAR